jgi:hypothetical protein
MCCIPRHRRALIFVTCQWFFLFLLVAMVPIKP